MAADHAGFELKQALEAWLHTNGYQYEDLGADDLDPSDDYPKFAFALANKVVGTGERGVIACGSGEGVCIAANRQRGIRAALAWDEEVAKASRNDDDSNILCLPARFIDSDLAIKILQTWLETPFSKEERHVRRIAEIDEG